MGSAEQDSTMCPAAFAASSEEKPRPSLHLLGLRARAVVAGSPITRFKLAHRPDIRIGRRQRCVAAIEDTLDLDTG
jgi:hypothetical protein